MKHSCPVRRTLASTVVVAAVVMNAVLPALLLGAFSSVQTGSAQPSGPAVLAGDDTKTGGGSG
ncbi:hypothetical protein [Deinococcus sp. 6GRE01]|uniref:hypothetical protein n=1 Tax=Deinococcus sp. 6GRE01 TaxID=2745873 RepID=UPI001E407533|nr:hypothetical protein [Deinococcus sp. 6GRE01]MCD0155739.1 hypothetical protein [Deinococcus sp. 6GRE01]